LKITRVRLFDQRGLRLNPDPLDFLDTDVIVAPVMQAWFSRLNVPPFVAPLRRRAYGPVISYAGRAEGVETIAVSMPASEARRPAVRQFKHDGVMDRYR
jgi:hypothetical protein